MNTHKYYDLKDGVGDPEPKPPETPEKKTEAPAPEKKTEAPVIMIPKPRFDEIDTRMKDAERKLAERDKTDEEARVAALKKKGEYETLALEANAKLAAVQQSLKDRDIKNAVYIEAVKVNCIDPEAAFQLMDKTKVTVDDSGAVVGVTEAVAALLVARPYLVKTAGGQGYNMSAGGSPREATADDISKMSMVQYNQYIKEHPELVG